MKSSGEVLQKLEARDFEALIGLVESEWLDAKEKPYHLDSPKQKLELAKDVAAFANAGGGIIIIGFDCEKQPTTSSERISKVCQFSVSLIDPNKYSQILADLVHPPPHGVSVLVFEAANSKGVAAIVVDVGMVTEKPYLVGKMLDENDVSIGAYFGFFERKRDVVPPVSISRIQQQLSAGMQWSSIDQRLQAIETNIASWGKAGPPVKRPAITDSVSKQRLNAARLTVGRHEQPIAYYTANAETDCDFPTLFTSRSERIVRLIDRPPQLRPQGFEVAAGDYSEIVHGQLRRNFLQGYRLIELWRDGLFIYIAQGDEDFLGWRMGGEDKPIHINNFVLAESILVFCWLTRFIFEEADPKPSVLRLTVGFDDMTRPSGSATLRDVPESRLPGGHVREAPEKRVEAYQLADWINYDPARVAYLLMEDIYHWFGFESHVVPFVDRTEPVPKLDAVKLIGKPLPTELPPGY